MKTRSLPSIAIAIAARELAVPRSLFAYSVLGACVLLGCGGLVSPLGPDGGPADSAALAVPPLVVDSGATVVDPSPPVVDAGGVAEPGPVVTLAEVPLGITPSYASYVGQSVTVPTGGPFGHLRFNWLTFDVHPQAFGTLYVLDREYLGKPSALGPSTPGFVGKSMAIEGAQYVFPSTIALAGGARYWFYTDAPADVLIAKTKPSEDAYSGGEEYVTANPEAPFAKATVTAEYSMDATFRLQGRAVR